jgi:YbbR domain-containing protein
MALRLPVLRTPSPAPAEPAPAGPGRTPPWRRVRLPRPRDLPAVLRRNLGLKLFSLLLAALLWVSINASERDAEREVTLAVTVRRLPHALVVTNVPANPVTARVRGPRTILEGVDTRETRLALDLSGAGPGDRTVELSGDMVRPELPRRLKLVRLEPARLKLHIESLVSRELPVRAEVAGLPALGYTIAGSSVTPAVVIAAGPASRLNDLKELKTEPIDVSGAAQDVERENVLLSWAGDFVTFATDHVTVQVAIKQVMMSREFNHVEVRVLNAAGMHAQVLPPWIDLTVTGPQRTLHNYEIKEGAVYVNAAGLKPGDHEVSVRVDLPPALQVETKKPEVLRLRLSGRGGR